MVFSSFILFSEPLRRKIPSTWVAERQCQREFLVSQRMPTFFFEKDATFCNDNGYIAVNVTLPLFIDERDGNICVRYTLP